MRPLTLFFGLLFLLNPEIAYVIDPIPDFIGYLLILAALKKTSYLDGKIYYAKVGACRLFVFSLIRFFVFLFVPKFSDMDMVLAVFSFAVIELVLLFPFMSQLFGGTDYLVSRHGSEKTLKKSKGVLVYLYVFFAIKEFLWFLSPAVSLFDPQYSGDYSHYFIDFQILKRGASALAVLITVLLGAVAVIMIAKYLFSIKGDKLLRDRIKVLYRENVLSNTGLITRIKLSRILTLFAAGSVFLINFYLDGINILPSFIGYFIIMLGALQFKTMRIPLTLISIFAFIWEIFAFAVRAIYIVSGAPENFSDFFTIVIGSVSALFMSLTVTLVALVLYKLAIKHAAVKFLKETVCTVLFGILTAVGALLFYSFPQLNEYTNIPVITVSFFFLYYIFTFTSKSKTWFEKAIS